MTREGGERWRAMQTPAEAYAGRCRTVAQVGGSARRRSDPSKRARLLSQTLVSMGRAGGSGAGPAGRGIERAVSQTLAIVGPGLSGGDRSVVQSALSWGCVFTREDRSINGPLGLFSFG